MREAFGMWKLGWAIMTLLGAALGASGQEPSRLTLPKEVKAKVGEVVWIEADAKGKVSWRLELADRDKLTRIDPAKLKSPNLLGLIPRVKGRFLIACITVEGGEIADAETLILVDQDEVKPIPPPDPKPVPPSDPLTAKLQAAYDADPAPKLIKESARGLVAALYSAMADHVKDPAVASTEDLRRDLEATGKSMLPPGALVAVRKVIAEEVKNCLGSQPVPLTVETRAAAGACFLRIASAVESVK